MITVFGDEIEMQRYQDVLIQLLNIEYKRGNTAHLQFKKKRRPIFQNYETKSKQKCVQQLLYS